MGETKNLSGQEAISKIKALAKGADICLFTTSLSKIPLSTRPMSTQEVDDDGSIWFLSSKSSHKNDDIENDNRVQLFYYNKTSAEYLSVYGEATIILDDKQQVERLWNPVVKTWFTQGKNDPDISVIKVRPIEAYYWDTQHNKLVATVKILAGAVTGKTMDDGLEGKIKV